MGKNIERYTDADLSIVWERTVNKLEKVLTPASIDAWIKPLKLFRVDTDRGEAIIVAPDSLSKKTVEQRHLSQITDVISVYLERSMEIKVILPRDIGRNFSDLTESDNTNPRYGSNLRSKYVFDNFVKGKSNELAFAASVAVAESPGQTTYNPLYLYGGVGLGKTHLMHSIGNYIIHRDPMTKVFYISAEGLMNEFINSIREHTNQEFRDKYRNIDVLLVDDIQFLSGKNETQEEFFHTFNALYFANKQIVISSDKPPMELKTLEERLTSRFGSGLIVDITLPDFETRTAILEKKAEMDSMNVPNDVIRLIAKSVSSNIRELEGALTRVTAYAKLTNTKITYAMAEKALKDMVNENEKRPVTIDYIQEIVCDYYKITVDEIRSKKRTANITFARHVAMYLSHMMLGATLYSVGQSFGGRDHTTVIHACNKIADEVESNDELRDVMTFLEKTIKGE